MTFDKRLDALKESVASCVVQSNCFRLPYNTVAGQVSQPQPDKALEKIEYSMKDLLSTTKTRNSNRGQSKTKNVPQVMITLDPSPNKTQLKSSRTMARSEMKGTSSFLEARAELISNMSR